jgi:hypothetical protein
MNQMPNLVHRHIAANYVRLGRMAEAQQMAGEFLRNDPDYKLEREAVWPHKNPKDLDDLIADLRRAGLPD